MSIRSWQSSNILLIIFLSSVGGCSTPPEKTNTIAQTPVATVHVYGNDDFDCKVTVAEEGHSAMSRVCGAHNPIKLMADKLPSQTTLLISGGVESSDDCAESTTGSDWWVKLQATAKSTSTEVLPAQGIVEKADSWLKGDGKPYVAPNLKIIDAGIKNAAIPLRIGCALVQLPAIQRENLLYFQPQPWAVKASDQNVQCHDGAVIAMAFENGNEGRYQCATLSGFDRKPFTAYDQETKLMIRGNQPVNCPDGKIVSAITFGENYFEKATLTCARFKNEAGVELAVNNLTANVWQTTDGRINACEDPLAHSEHYLMSQPNAVLTGLDLETAEIQFWCSQVTPSVP